MKVFIINLLAVLVLIVLVIFAFDKIVTQLADNRLYFESCVNKDVILHKDTLKIIDCDWSYETFILSNGIEVNKKFIELQLNNKRSK